jgi:hypothetical protein
MYGMDTSRHILGMVRILNLRQFLIRPHVVVSLALGSTAKDGEALANSAISSSERALL